MSSRDLWELSQFSRGFTGGTKVMPRLVRTTINQATAKFWQRFWIMNWFRKTMAAIKGVYWCFKAFLSGFLGHTLYPGNISVLWERAHQKSVNLELIRWFAGPMGQTTCQPSVWCSKYYFFFIKSFKILCTNPFNYFFYFSFMKLQKWK